MGAPGFICCGPGPAVLPLVVEARGGRAEESAGPGGRLQAVPRATGEARRGEGSDCGPHSTPWVAAVATAGGHTWSRAGLRSSKWRGDQWHRQDAEEETCQLSGCRPQTSLSLSRKEFSSGRISGVSLLESPGAARDAKVEVMPGSHLWRQHCLRCWHRPCGSHPWARPALLGRASHSHPLRSGSWHLPRTAAMGIMPSS